MHFGRFVYSLLFVNICFLGYQQVESTGIIGKKLTFPKTKRTDADCKIQLGKEKISKIKDAIKKRRFKDYKTESNEVLDTDLKMLQERNRLKWWAIPKTSLQSSSEEETDSDLPFGKRLPDFPIDITIPHTLPWSDTMQDRHTLEFKTETPKFKDSTNERNFIKMFPHNLNLDSSSEEMFPESIPYAINSDFPEKNHLYSLSDTSYQKSSPEKYFWEDSHYPKPEQTLIKPYLHTQYLKDSSERGSRNPFNDLDSQPALKKNDKSNQITLQPEPASIFPPLQNAWGKPPGDENLQVIQSPSFHPQSQNEAGHVTDREIAKLENAAVLGHGGDLRSTISSEGKSQTAHVVAHNPNQLPPTPTHDEMKHSFKASAATVPEFTQLKQATEPSQQLHAAPSQLFSQPKHADGGQWQHQSQTLLPWKSAQKLQVNENESKLYEPDRFYEQPRVEFVKPSPGSESNQYHKLISNLGKAVGLPEKAGNVKSRPGLPLAGSKAGETARHTVPKSGQSLNTLLTPSLESHNYTKPNEIMQVLLPEGGPTRTTKFQPSIEETIDQILREIELSGRKVEPEIYIGEMGPPVTVRHYAKPVIIEEFQGPVIIDHHQKAIIERHRPPAPVIVDHYLPPEVFEVKDQRSLEAVRNQTYISEIGRKEESVKS